MVIYVDVLMFSNIIVDYLLLSATSLIVKRSVSLLRLIVAAVVGGISSLYIFVDSGSVVIDILFKIVVAAAMISISIGIKRGFILSLAVFCGISFSLNGAIICLYNLVNSKVFYSENLINYINISPLTLIAVTAVLYMGLKIVQRILLKKAYVYKAELSIEICGYKYDYTALVDSGNSVTDPFGNAQVFIVGTKEFETITGYISNDELLRRSRIIPVKTVNGNCLLEALRCDNGTVTADGMTFGFSKPIVAASSVPIENGYNAIVPQHSLQRVSDT